MSKPSNFLQRPSNIVVQRKQRKDTMMSLEQGKLTRELSNVSNEAYHGVESASIPFVWESQPGTPKVRFKENSLPPLTPPPSYFQNATKKPKNNNSPKARFLQSILFPKRGNRKGCAPPQTGSSKFPSYFSSSSSSSSLSSSSSPRPTSYSVPSSPMTHPRKNGEDEDLYEVTSSSLCFGNARSRGCYSSMFKKVLLGDFL